LISNLRTWHSVGVRKEKGGGMEGQRFLIPTSFLPYSVFHRFRQSKFAYRGSILSSGQFLLLPQRPIETMLTIKVFKIDSKIIISLPWSKSAKHTVQCPPPFNLERRKEIKLRCDLFQLRKCTHVYIADWDWWCDSKFF
jgi:hypothetical protein